MSTYAHPELLVTPDWAAKHASDPSARLVEVDVDTKAYDEGAWAWNTEPCDPLVRDILSKARFEQLVTRSGIDNDTTVVLYGDNNNWFAAWAFWEMKVYGHADVRIMDGGRRKWLSEGRDLDTQPEGARPGKNPYVAKDASMSGVRKNLPAN